MAGSFTCRLFCFHGTEVCSLGASETCILLWRLGAFVAHALGSWAWCVLGTDSGSAPWTLLWALPGTVLQVHQGPSTPSSPRGCHQHPWFYAFARLVSSGRRVVGEDAPCPPAGLADEYPGFRAAEQGAGGRTVRGRGPQSSGGCSPSLCAGRAQDGPVHSRTPAGHVVWVHGGDKDPLESRRGDQ